MLFERYPRDGSFGHLSDN